MVTRPAQAGEVGFFLGFEGDLVFDRLARRDGLRSVVVDDRIGMVGVAEITFSGLEERWSEFRIGRAVVLRVLGGTESSPLFEGQITALRHGYRHGEGTLTVVASNALHALAVHSHVRAFGDPDRGTRHTDSDIVETVIAGHGLSPRVDRSQAQHPYVVQRNETDLAFVLRLAARNDWIVASEGSHTVVCGRRRTRPEIEVDRGTGALLDLEYTWSPHAVPEQVAVGGWNYLTKEAAPATQHSVDAVGGGTQGFGGTGDPSRATFVGDAQIQEPAAALALAQGTLQRLAHSLVRGRATVVGNGLLRPHRVVRFAGHPSGFNPTGYVVAARHRLLDGQYQTDLRFTSNTPPGGPA